VDWRALRTALGLTQEDFGRMLCISQEAVSLLETGVTQSPSAASLKLLRMWLSMPHLYERLERANVPHPFPEDLTREESLTGL
jgi:transcriptional regulator with XRE-family HTH domain